jgi:hypothetical protein
VGVSRNSDFDIRTSFDIWLSTFDIRIHPMKVIPFDRPDLPPLEMPARFRTEIVYFMTPPGDKGAPAALPGNEYWIDVDDARKWLDELVVYVVSPLDAENKAEIELTEDHERWLQWLVDNGVQRVRVE